MHVPRALRLGTLCAASLTVACQLLSASVTSPSDSISATGHALAGSAESISTSSGSGGDGASEASYGRDLRAYVASFVRAGGQATDFAPGATRVAAGHGVSDWESDPDTGDAIGAGLAAAGQGDAQAQRFCAEQGFDAELTRRVVSAASRHAN